MALSRWMALLLALATALFAQIAGAHEIRPAFLQVREIASGQYDVLWKVPRTDATVLDLTPRFASGFTLKETDKGGIIDGFVFFNYRLKGTQDLAGTRLGIAGLERSTIDALAEIRMRDGRRYSYLLQPTQPWVTIESNPSWRTVARTYVLLGIEHILTGCDHLLFVLALVIITRGTLRIVKTITAFTLAHSITLSIVFLAVEILRGMEGKATLTGRKPWLVAFIF